MCVPRPLRTALGLFLLLRLLWRSAWASGTPSAKGFWCQLLMRLIVPHIPITTIPSPVQMLHISAEIRAVGVCPPPHTRWLALLRLFSVLTYLLLNFWESCEFWKEKKTSPTTNTKKKKKINKFPFHKLSQNIENIFKKHPGPSQKGEKSRNRGSQRCGKLLSIQRVWTAWSELPLPQWQETLHTKTSLGSSLGCFQFHCTRKSRYFPR